MRCASRRVTRFGGNIPYRARAQTGVGATLRVTCKRTKIGMIASRRALRTFRNRPNHRARHHRHRLVMPASRCRVNRLARATTTGSTIVRASATRVLRPSMWAPAIRHVCTTTVRRTATKQIGRAACVGAARPATRPRVPLVATGDFAAESNPMVRWGGAARTLVRRRKHRVSCASAAPARCASRVEISLLSKRSDRCADRRGSARAERERNLSRTVRADRGGHE